MCKELPLIGRLHRNNVFCPDRLAIAYVGMPPPASLFFYSGPGDPHMTGFLGQKFDFTGEDGQWYCLISDLPDIHVNMVRAMVRKKVQPLRSALILVFFCDLVPH